MAPCWGRMTRGAGPGSSMTSARGAVEGRARAPVSRPKGEPPPFRAGRRSDKTDVYFFADF
jgi:hypothetical protein